MSDARNEVTTIVLSAHDRYRWLLLTGWFILFATIFSFVIAAPQRPQAADGMLMSIAMLAFISYSAAMKRYWIALALFIAAAGVLTAVAF
jgi:hypothetical protein